MKSILAVISVGRGKLDLALLTITFLFALLASPVALAQAELGAFKAGGTAEITLINEISVAGGNWNDSDVADKAPVATYPEWAAYRITVKNTGEVDLSGVMVDGPNLGFVHNVGDLAVGQSEVLRTDFFQQRFLELFVDPVCDEQEDIDNWARATGQNSATGATVQVVDSAWLRCVEGGTAAVDIIKEIRVNGGNWMDANTPGTAPVEPFPGTAEYRFRIENIGTTSLIGAEVTDMMLFDDEVLGLPDFDQGDVVYVLPIGEPNPMDGNLPPIFLAAMSPPEVCGTAGNFTNTANVSAMDEVTQVMVMDSDSAVLVCVDPPAADIEIVKEIRVDGGAWMDANAAGTAPVIPFPGTAEYRFRIENTGNTSLIGAEVADLMLFEDEVLDLPPLSPGDVIYVLPPGAMIPPDGTLPPFELGVMAPAEVCGSAGEFMNTAEVSAQDEVTMMPVMDQDSAYLVCVDPPNPDIEIIKEIRVDGGDWMDANDAGTAPVTQAPGTAEYRFRIENTGNTSLIAAEVSDLLLFEDEVLELPPLAPGDVVYVIPLGEPSPPDGTLPPFALGAMSPDQICDSAGEFPNTAAVSALDESTGSMVMDDDPAVLVCEGADVCLVVIDEEGLDNDFQSVEAAAAAINAFNGYSLVEPDELINDDRPTEFGNPPLLWNELVAAGMVPDPDGRLVKLPTGQVDDEGWFALPPGPDILYKDNSRPPNCGLDGGYDEWIERYIAGTLSQHCLDEVLDVMPIRNQELANLVGQTCVAVVYDSDISMNYEPIFGNLQGARLGLFTFTVLALEVPGTIPESGSSTSLYDLWLYVEEPGDGGVPLQVPIVDHEPDSIEINTASYRKGVLTVIGESDWAPGAYMTVTVAGEDAGTDPLVGQFLLEEPMIYIGGGEYELVFPTGTNVRGRRVIIQTDEGGAYNDRIGE